MAAGRFRQDLLFRLLSITIDLLPLRKREDDIRELVLHFMNKFSNRDRKGTKGFSPEFMVSLEAYRWPVNARELANAMENILAEAGDSSILFPKHLPVHIRVKLARASVGKRGQAGTREPEEKEAVSFPALGRWKEFREAAIHEAEKGYLLKLSQRHAGGVRSRVRHVRGTGTGPPPREGMPPACPYRQNHCGQVVGWVDRSITHRSPRVFSPPRVRIGKWWVALRFTHSTWPHGWR